MSNLLRPIMKHEQKYDQFTKTNSCLLENNTKVLGNDDAETIKRAEIIKRRTLCPI